MFVYSVITCKYTTQTRHYGSHHITMNTNFSGIQKLRNIFGAESLHCYPYLQNTFNGQSFSLDCQMMQLYLLLCLWPTLIHMLESKVFTRNQCSGSHTRQKVAYEDKEQESCRCSTMNTVKHSYSELMVCDTMQPGWWTPQCCGATCCPPHQNRTDIYSLNTQTRVSSKIWYHCTRPHSITFHKIELLSLLLTKK